MLLCLALVGLIGLHPGSASAATPKPTPPPPTAPLPIDLVVHPDSDVLGQPGLQVAPGLSQPPNVPATGWMLVDATSGDVLAANNARAQLMPASTLKLLTAVTVSPKFPDDNALYTASEAAVAVDGTRVGLVSGSVYRIGDLLHGLLMSSGNDTAVALSELMGGDGPASIAMMNHATRLGATDTVAGNTSGLDFPGQVTSARDLALIGQEVLDDPRLAPMVAQPGYQFPGAGTDFSPTRPYFPIYNHNKMVGVYPGTLGLKTGFTMAARGSFVGAAERDGRRLMCTILHSEGQESDFCQQLLDWAFSQPAPSTPVTTLAASVKASAPPAAEVTRPATPETGTATTDVGLNPSSQGRGALPPWAMTALVLAGFAVAAAIASRALGRGADRAARDLPTEDGP